MNELEDASLLAAIHNIPQFLPPEDDAPFYIHLVDDENGRVKHTILALLKTDIDPEPDEIGAVVYFESVRRKGKFIKYKVWDVSLAKKDTSRDVLLQMLITLSSSFTSPLFNGFKKYPIYHLQPRSDSKYALNVVFRVGSDADIYLFYKEILVPPFFISELQKLESDFDLSTSIYLERFFFFYQVRAHKMEQQRGKDLKKFHKQSQLVRGNRKARNQMLREENRKYLAPSTSTLLGNPFVDNVVMPQSTEEGDQQNKEEKLMKRQRRNIDKKRQEREIFSLPHPDQGQYKNLIVLGVKEELISKCKKGAAIESRLGLSKRKEVAEKVKGGAQKKSKKKLEKRKSRGRMKRQEKMIFQLSQSDEGNLLLLQQDSISEFSLFPLESIELNSSTQNNSPFLGQLTTTPNDEKERLELSKREKEAADEVEEVRKKLKNLPALIKSKIEEILTRPCGECAGRDCHFCSQNKNFDFSNFQLKFTFH